MQGLSGTLGPSHRKIIYQDGQSVSSHFRVEPFAVLFWALGIVLTHILLQAMQPAGPASLNCCTGMALALYWQ